jgi:hypothetical protein
MVMNERENLTEELGKIQAEIDELTALISENDARSALLVERIRVREEVRVSPKAWKAWVDSQDISEVDAVESLDINSAKKQLLELFNILLIKNTALANQVIRKENIETKNERLKIVLKVLSIENDIVVGVKNENISEVTIPCGVTKIEKSAFYG